jgi:hypothetical protein
MQTELFDLPSPRTLSEDSAVSKTSFLEKTFITLRLDQMIGVTLVFLVFFVLTFSWGVEKGKKMTRESQVIRPVGAALSSPDLAGSVAPAVAKAAPAHFAEAVVPKEVPITVAELPKPVAKVTKPDGKFTIQHATYITQTAAEREIQNSPKWGTALL